MEAIGIPARLAHLHATDLVLAFDNRVLSPLLGHESHISLTRRLMATWLFLYLGSLLVYFAFASLDYLLYFVIFTKRVHHPSVHKSLNVRREIWLSVKSLVIMTAFSTPAEVLMQLGYGKAYSDPAKYGYTYLVISPIFFILFSDFIIYFIHRGLHSRILYRHIHKLHHSFVITSPYAAFAFHPIDGYMQGCSYQVFVFLFPFHSAIHLFSLVAVSMWTINIHDHVTFGIPGINGAAHHTIHHTTYKSNYGQYTTFWDKLFGTFRDPHLWQKQGAPTLSEKQVYGKHA